MHILVLASGSIARQFISVCTTIVHVDPRTNSSLVYFLVNSPPIVPNATLSTLLMDVFTTVTCIPVPTQDDDGDPNVTYRFRWIVNAAEILSVRGPLLNEQLYAKGDVISCEVAASDGTNEGSFSPMAQTTIGNQELRV